MHLLNQLRRAPQKIPINFINVVQKLTWEGIALHNISWNGRRRSLDKNCLASKRKKVGLPTSKFLLNFLKDKIEVLATWPSVLNRKSQIFAEIRCWRKPQNITQGFPRVSNNIRGEKHSGFGFINWLDMLQNSSNAFLIAEQLLPFALVNNTRLSAKTRWEKAIPFLDALTWVHFFSLHFSSIKCPKTSMQRIKR